jgi:hypothetical protein
MGMGVGAAMTGLRPIVEGMNMGFLLLAFNQISNNCGMLHYTSGGQYKVPMVIRGPGGVGRQLGAEHSQRLESYFQSIPGKSKRSRGEQGTRGHARKKSCGDDVVLCSCAFVFTPACRVGPGRQAQSDPLPPSRHARRRAAGCCVHCGQLQGAAQVCYPQRQPHHLLRARAALQHQG